MSLGAIKASLGDDFFVEYKSILHNAGTFLSEYSTMLMMLARDCLSVWALLAATVYSVACWLLL